MENFTYANKFSVAVGVCDVQLVFGWAIPNIDLFTGEMKDESSLKISSVSMSKDSFMQFAGLVKEMNEKYCLQSGEDLKNGKSTS